MDAFEILVLILAIVFTILLVGLTLSVFIFVKILKDVRHITEKAALAADNIQHAAHFFKNTSGAAAVMKLVGNAVDVFRRNHKKEQEK